MHQAGEAEIGSCEGSLRQCAEAAKEPSDAVEVVLEGGIVDDIPRDELLAGLDAATLVGVDEEVACVRIGVRNQEVVHHGVVRELQQRGILDEELPAFERADKVTLGALLPDCSGPGWEPRVFPLLWPDAPQSREELELTRQGQARQGQSLAREGSELVFGHLTLDGGEYFCCQAGELLAGEVIVGC